MIERLFDFVLRLLKELKYCYLRFRIKCRLVKNSGKRSDRQNLKPYYDPQFLESVSAWGRNTTWNEIQFLLSNCEGRVLDIACGTCVLFPVVSKLGGCSLYGCDISEYLIEEAVKKGVPRDRLSVCDATRTPYENDHFDYSYSIGSLEHFTEDGIARFLSECARITKQASFHQIPTSRNGRDEGWLGLDQSYFNNSVSWWLSKFRQSYRTVYVLDSAWEDPISLGKWFICRDRILN